MASSESLEQGPPETSGSPAGAAPSHDLDRQQVPPAGDTRLNDKEIERGIDAPDSDKGSSDRGVENAVVDEKAGDVPPEQKVSAPPRTKAQNAVIVFALCLGVFLAALDNTIVTTALPTISAHFHSSTGYTWIGSAYLLANAASTPSWGKFADIWGRKPVLVLAGVIFFIGSTLSAASTSMTMLLVGRAVQGVGGGGLIILANICIGDLFSQRDRGIYYGLVGMTWALASAIGPVVGGAFTEKVSWRWCFYINLPLTGLGISILFFFLHLRTPRTPLIAGLKAIDWVGTLTIVGGTVMFLLGLEFGGVTFPWKSATVLCLIIFGIFTWVLFFLNEWKLAKYPIIPLHLFRSLSNVASLLVCFFHGAVFIAGAYFLPLYFQAVLGATPILSGVYLLPFALTLSLTSAVTGVIIKKTGRYREPIWIGLALMTLGFGLYIALPSTHQWSRIILFQIIAGLGVGPQFQSPLIALQSGVRPRDIAAATATFGFTRNVATSISVVIGGVVFQNGMQRQRAALTAALGPDLASLLSGGSAAANVGIAKSIPPGPKQVVVRDAFWRGLRDIWYLYVALAFCGLLASAAIKMRKLSKEHEETETGLDVEEQKRLDRIESRRRRAAGGSSLGPDVEGRKA